MCISAVLLKRISYDIIRQTRTDAIMFDNDASACYDHIIPSLAAMMSRRAGMTRNGSHVLIRLLLNMEYYVRTAYGVSSVAFSNLTKLLLGVMQGAGHSGTLWALTSSILLDIMDETQGAEFHSPYPNRLGCQRTGEAFVDDTSLWILRMGLMFMMLTTLMQQTAQRWARLIHASGGALNLLKCFWYGIHWSYTPTGIARMCKIYMLTVTHLLMYLLVLTLLKPKV